MTAIVLKDRVKEITSTAGTADFVLGGASSGYQTFSVIGPNNYTYYCCFDNATGDWEVGYGQYTTTAGGTLVRSAVLSNSAATTSKIAFAAGPKDVFITYPAEKAIYEEETGETLINGGPITVWGTGIIATPNSFSSTVGQMFADVDSFSQLYNQNLNGGQYASSDFVAYNNQSTTGEEFYVDMGINSSGFNDTATYPIFPQNSAYVYSAGVDGGTIGQNADLYVGTGTSNSDVVLFVGGLDKPNIAGVLKSATQALVLQDGASALTTDSGEKLQVYGDSKVTGAASFGSTVLLAQDPTLALQAATKAYVDNAASTGIHIHTPVAAETSAALSAVYTQGGTTFNITDITGTNTVVTSTTNGLAVNDQIWLTSAGNGLSTNTPYFVYATPTGTSLQLSATYGGPLLTGLTNASGLTYATRANSGVGAFLEASANATLPVSGVTTGDRVLVYNQSTAYWNGVYTVTSLGSGASKWKLTRATDADYYSPSDTDGLSEGDYFLVQSNSESYVLTTPGAIIIGYTGITYTLFASVPTYTGGTNISVSSGVISLTGTVAATNGGTGYASYTAGQMLYADTTTSLAPLGIGSQYQSLLSTGSAPTWGAIPLNQSAAVSGALGATNGGTGQTAYALGDTLYSDATNSITRLAGNTTTTKKFLGQTGTGAGSAAPSWQQPAATDITGLAPSATTDTTNADNITSGTLGTSRLSGSYTGITGVGTLTAGTWNGSTIAAAYGGTGQSSYTVGDLLYASTTTALSKLADVAVGNALISGGVGSAPSWGKIGLATHVSGTLPVANGGTGNTTGQAASVANAVTFNTTGGAAAGTTFDGSVARTIDYSSVGAAPTAGSTSITTLGTIATGTWSATAIAVAKGGTGATDAATARTNLGATTVGSNMFTLTNPSAITFPRFNADNTVSALDAATFRTAIGAGTGSGTVTSVTGTSPVASSGGTTPAISLATGYGDTQNPFASKTANYFLAAPNGVAGLPTFRAIVAADIPTLNQNTTGTSGGLTGTPNITVGTVSGTTITASTQFSGPGTGLTGTASSLTAGAATTATTATTATNWGSYGAVPSPGTSFGGANQIGRSDASGYTYFNYINSNTSNSENPTVSQVIVTNGSDNFYRKSSIASFTSYVQSNASGSWGISITGNAATSNLSAYAGGAVVENTQTIGSNYTMTSGRNGVSAGPITISTGVTVTIPTGSSWSIV